MRVSDLLRLPAGPGRPRRHRHRGPRPASTAARQTGKKALDTARPAAGRPAGAAVRRGPHRRHAQPAARAAGHGHLGQGRHGAPRRRPGRPAGREHHLLQGADQGGAGARLPLADQAAAARARDARRLRPVALRGRRRRAGARARRAADLEAPLRARSTGSRSSLVADGTTVVKCFLHISKDESRDRLLRRLDKPDKLWKFNPGDIDSRAEWEPADRGLRRRPGAVQHRRPRPGTSSRPTTSGTGTGRS